MSMNGGSGILGAASGYGGGGGSAGGTAEDARWSEYAIAARVNEALKAVVSAMNEALDRGITTEFGVPMNAEGRYELQSVKFMKRIKL